MHCRGLEVVMFLIKLSKILDLKPFLAYAAALNLLETSKKKKKRFSGDFKRYNMRVPAINSLKITCYTINAKLYTNYTQLYPIPV